MSKHWDKATEEQVEWADEHRYVIAPEEDDLNPCRGCAILHRRSTIGWSICENIPCLDIILKKPVEQDKGMENVISTDGDDLINRTLAMPASIHTDDGRQLLLTRWEPLATVGDFVSVKLEANIVVPKEWKGKL